MLIYSWDIFAEIFFDFKRIQKLAYKNIKDLSLIYDYFLYMTDFYIYIIFKIFKTSRIN